MSDWRDQLPKVEAEFEGRVSPDLTRQQARWLKRRIARAEHSEAKQAKRKPRRRRG